MLTIFATPKPFKGHIDIIQRNAIASWCRLAPACEVFLCGVDDMASVAKEFNVHHLPDVAVSQYGTPLLDSVFAEVRRHASFPIVCYVNADIMLLQDLIDAVRRVRLTDFLLVGQRWNVNLDRPWDFSHEDWQVRLRHYLLEHGTQQPPVGSDYFIFPRDSAVGQIKPFVVGRPGWDNWLIYHARKIGVAVVDLSSVVQPIHQNHDYRHVPAGRDLTYEGPEADRNYQLIDDMRRIFLLSDATHVMTEKGIQRAWDREHLHRRWQSVATLHPILRPYVDGIDRIGNKVRSALSKIWPCHEL